MATHPTAPGHFKTPFTIDLVWQTLDCTILHPIGAILLAAIGFARSRIINGPELTVYDYLIVNPDTRRWRLLLLLVALKTANRALNRLALNNGWKADPPRWAEEVVVVTGGSGGIGGEIVELLAQRTSKVAVLDLGTPQYRAQNVKYYQCDVTDEARVHEAAERIRQDLGEVTVVVNNAGIAIGKEIMQLSKREFEKTLRVNTVGAFIVIKEFLPYIAEQNHGHFLTMASSASYMSIPNIADYAASKAAVMALHEVLAAELTTRYKADNVRTSIVCPTKVQTDMGRGMADAGSLFLSPTLLARQVAQSAVDMIDSGLSGHCVTPLFAHMVLPSIRALPHWFRWLFSKFGETDKTVTERTGRRARMAHRNREQYGYDD